MTHGSLFSGIGGFDLAAEWMGWENLFHCEWNEFGQKVLNYYWPNAECFTDITKSDFTKYANKIDILTGGFPCQPYSMAGKRLGKEDERHLWPHMYRAIQEIKPRWIVGENVRGLISWNGGLVFEEVQADLEAAGYEVQPFLLPACGVNAPHRRDRIWFVAYSNNKGRSSRFGEIQSKNGKVSQWNNNAEFGNSSDGITADSDGIRWDNGSNNWEERQISHDEERNTEKSESKWSGRISGVGQICGDGFTSNTKNLDALRLGENNSNRESLNKSQWEEVRSKFGDISSKGDATNTESSGFSTEMAIRELERNERFKFSIKRNQWHSFPSVSPLCTGDDGLSNRLDSITFPKWRNESIKAGGNAIVPQVVYQIFKTIEQYEHIKSSMETN